MSETQLKSRKTRAIGDALRFTKDPLKFFREIISETENAPVIPFKVGPLNSVLVNDTSLLRELLNNYETFEKKVLPTMRSGKCLTMASSSVMGMNGATIERH